MSEIADKFEKIRNRADKLGEKLSNVMDKVVIILGKCILGFFALTSMFLIFSIPETVGEYVSYVVNGKSDIITLTGINTIIPMMSYILVMILFVYLAKKLNIAKFNLSFINKKNVLIIFIIVIIDQVSAALFYGIIQSNGMGVRTVDYYIDNENISWYLDFITGFIYAPIVEEIIFRGYIIGRLFVNNPIIGILISTLLFGIGHLPENPISFMLFASSGLLFSIAYYKTKRLEVPIIIHSMGNILITLGTF
ncbi:CPBP family intramembrane glutamic endopeptidase [Peptostreptococcus faecalis]|uniref:CPBP family intramembrane glutamic endopeptidase n=1 Tax=Peptostreptococcus faecalis TaxID=2045015 RepID=UPI000C79BB43|nr:CPBP family intramembrane glutamic endopeptidase [Peptostreptococcus faecalis]